MQPVGAVRRGFCCLLVAASCSLSVLSGQSSKTARESPTGPHSRRVLSTLPLFLQTIDLGGRRAPRHAQYGAKQALARLLLNLGLNGDLSLFKLFEVVAGHTTQSTDEDRTTWWSVSAWVFFYQLGDGPPEQSLVTSTGRIITMRSRQRVRTSIIPLKDWVLDFEDAHHEVWNRGFVHAPKRDPKGGIEAGARLSVKPASAVAPHPIWEGPWQRFDRAVYCDATYGLVQPVWETSRSRDSTPSEWDGGYQAGSSDESDVRTGEDYPPVSYTRRPLGRDPWRNQYVFNRRLITGERDSALHRQPVSYSDLALFEAALGNWYEACLAIDQALKSNSKDTEIRHIRALLFLIIRDLDKAREEFLILRRQGVEVKWELELLNDISKRKSGSLGIMVPFSTSLGIVLMRLNLAPLLIDDPFAR